MTTLLYCAQCGKQEESKTTSVFPLGWQTLTVDGHDYHFCSGLCQYHWTLRVPLATLNETHLKSQAQAVMKYAFADWLVNNLSDEALKDLAKADKVVFELPSMSIVLKNREGEAPQFEIKQ